MHPTDACRFEILIPGEQRFFLKAANSTERQRWIIALGSCKAGITNVNEVEKMRELFTSLVAFLLLLARSMWDLVCAHISYFRIEVDYLGGNLLFSWLLFSRRYMSVLNYLPEFCVFCWRPHQTNSLCCFFSWTAVIFYHSKFSCIVSSLSCDIFWPLLVTSQLTICKLNSKEGKL